MSLARIARIAFVAASYSLSGTPAMAELPDAATLLTDFGYTPADIAQVLNGKLVSGSIAAGSDRELVASMAFQVPVPPAQLVKELRAGLLVQVDPSVIAQARQQGALGSADFAKLTLGPDAAKQAQLWTSGDAGVLNRSSDEIAAFQKLGAGAPPATVEAQLRATLFARAESYRTGGLAGIAPYVRAGGAPRSPADEIATATAAIRGLAKYAPAASQLLRSYPNSKPAGTEESFGWTYFDARGTPTIVLQHVLFVPNGDGWIVVQRQFYVSTGYNAEQAVAALLPVATGTVVIYGNRTSTDQITGFGGSTKRSLGSKVLASQLKAVFEKLRAKVK